MSKRSSHIGKSYSEKEAYRRYLLKSEYEPTLDDSFQFHNTEKAGEDLTEPRSGKKRSVNLIYIFMEHFREHWLEWILSGLILIGIYLVFDSRYELKLLDYKLSITNKSIDKIEETNFFQSKRGPVCQKLLTHWL